MKRTRGLRRTIWVESGDREEGGGGGGGKGGWERGGGIWIRGKEEEVEEERGRGDEARKRSLNTDILFGL